jgi:predicted DNA-binding protein (MmcQ/YjbR family)
MLKKHWISIYFDGAVPAGEVQRLIENSFLLVVSKMTKKGEQSLSIYL